ncbi:MAG: dockerin type I repeat-containing protein [Ruminococcus sp.]
MFKKIIAVALSVVSLSVASLPLSAAQAATVKRVSKGTTQSDGQLIFYSYNVPSDTKAFIKVQNDKTGDSTTYRFSSFYNHPQSYQLGAGTFSTQVGVQVKGGSGYGSSPSVDLRNSAGRYERIRIKLSEFSSYFNKDGSHTQTSHGESHKFIFREEEPDSDGTVFSSVLCIYSGGAINHVVPDSKGEVELYVSTNLGTGVDFTTEFHYDSTYSSGGGGGLTSRSIGGLAIGDCDPNGYLSISDATMIQKYAADLQKFDSAQTRCGDVNKDGNIDIADATELQMFLAR